MFKVLDFVKATAFHIGGQSGTDGRGDDPPLQAGAAEQLPLKSQHVDVCERRCVCQRMVGGCVMALRVPRQTGLSYE